MLWGTSTMNCNVPYSYEKLKIINYNIQVTHADHRSNYTKLTNIIMLLVYISELVKKLSKSIKNILLVKFNNIFK